MNNYSKKEQAKNRKTWLKALKSGKYKKAKGQLRKEFKDGTGYCCLGVACELYRKAIGGEWEQNTSFSDRFGDNEYGVLPSDVKAWLGLNRREGNCENSVACGKKKEFKIDLVGINDNSRGFGKIIKVLEEGNIQIQ